MQARSERRFGVLRLREPYLGSHQSADMFSDLQITVDHREFDHQAQCCCLGIISPLLEPVAHGVIAPTVSVVLNQETQKYEFVTGEA